MKNKRMSQRGITLIALIITIIVMLILVAVTVRTAINSGLFGHAKNAVSKWGDAESQEQTDLDTISNTMEAITNPEVDFPPTSPIYARLYTDGTFILSGTDYKDQSKTLSKDYGDISAKKFYWTNDHSGLPDWSTEPIKNVLVYDKIQPVNTSCWFFRGLVDRSEGKELQDTIETMDLRNLDTSRVKNMSEMFTCCNNLTELNVSNFDTHNATNMQSMFNNCFNLSNLDVSNFDTHNVINMKAMFGNCRSLTTLNLSNFCTSSVTNMSYMFQECRNLVTLDVSNFNTSDVTNMQYMFSSCKALKTLNLSNFNTSNVTNMYRMFAWSYQIIELDLSNFIITEGTNVEEMLECNALQTIYVKDEATKAKLQELKSDCTITVK